MENVLLLFDRDHPCWNRDLIERIGEDPGLLEALEDRGFLIRDLDIYQLTSTGREAYRLAAKECYYDVPEGEPQKAPRRSIERTLLQILLDKAIWGRWGIKEFRAGTKLPYAPDLSGKNLFTGTTEDLCWTYRDDPLFRELQTKFLLPSGPDATPPDLCELEEWLHERGTSYGNLELDLLFLHHYDSVHFNGLRPQPNDRLGLYHTDRFYFQLFPDISTGWNTALEDMGKFHLFLESQRRIFLPWFFNRDSTGYDSVNWWFWVTKTETNLTELKALIRPLSERLITPVLPIELFGISMEALEQVEEKREYHWDLFEEIAVSFSRRL